MRTLKIGGVAIDNPLILAPIDVYKRQCIIWDK